MNRSVTLVLVGLSVAPLLLTSACKDDDECCPVSETFTCTDFDFGGARSLQAGGSCKEGYTDNLPKVTGKKVDVKGCTYWEVDPGGGRTCGVAPTHVDTGRNDAGNVDAADAASDATQD